MRTWLVVAVLIAVMASPMLTQTSVLEDSGDTLQYSSPTQATISPSSGWTSGGEEITITGSGFSDLAFSNTTDDGINHQWVESTLDYTDEAGRFNSIVMDSNGHLHVAHINGGNYQIRHSIHDGTSWNSVKINDCGSTYCWDVHMVIDDNDDLHLAYTTYTSWSETLVYMHYDGTTWTSEEVSSNANFGPIGIAVDSNNHPHISYAVKGEYCGDGLRIASYDGSSWNYDIVAAGDNRGCDSAIVIDDNDNIYIAYQNRDNSKLLIATDKSGSWDSYIVDAGTSPSNLYPGYMTSMVMDEQGQFHIAHFDDKDDDLRYSTGAPNSQWTTTIVESSGHTGRDPSIALDSSDNPHIVYNSWAGFDLKYAVYNSTTTSWDKSFISTTGDVGKGNSIIIDPNGVMHVPFSDEDSDVLKYATKSTGVSQTNEIRVQFGQYGSVTGTVVDDTTITVMTPLSGLTPDTIDITLWDKDDNSHILSSTFEFISQDDLDNDGVLNTNDDCPNDSGTSTQDLTGCPDDDGDGYSNSGDAFPSDASENSDSDGDGVGDNADAFPLNANEWEDLDGNQIPDNSESSKIQITSSSQDLKIHPYHIYANNLTLTLDVITSEGFTMVSIESNPSITPNTGGLPYGMYGGDSQTITLESSQIMTQIPSEFFTGAYISDFSPLINFTVHVTGTPHGCEGSPEFWDTQQQTVCPSKVANYQTDYYANFSMMLWNGDDDNDGVANSWDFFPLDANESQDSDGDGVGDNSDAFPMNAFEIFDTDGDGVGDNSDAFPNDSSESIDADGDGVGDNSDAFPNDANETLDSDGDGIGDINDLCINTMQNNSVDGDGCSLQQLDDDTNETDDTQSNQTNATDNTNQTEVPVDADGDGVSDLEDNCPGTSPNTQVDAFGCEVVESQNEDDEPTSAFESFFSGDSDPVTTTVGIGAILLALFTLLQTNAVAAVLPDAFRWVQVLRKNSKLTKEERNELTYLQSVVQAYHSNPEELAEELVNLKGDITARFTNNQIKKETREKLLILIEELQSSTPNELYQIAHNDVYFGLSEVIDTGDRTKLLDEKVAMTASEDELNQPESPSHYSLGEMDDKGTYWIECPEGSESWYYRYTPEDDWSIYEN